MEPYHKQAVLYVRRAGPTATQGDGRGLVDMQYCRDFDATDIEDTLQQFAVECSVSLAKLVFYFSIKCGIA